MPVIRMGIPSSARALAQRLAGMAGYQLIPTARLKSLRKAEDDSHKYLHAGPFVGAMPAAYVAQLFDLVRHSRAQLFQDLFVLCQSGFKREGFFVEFGATDGLCLSNTDLLEKQFGWRGILSEPARKWQAALRANRTATIDFGCVWSTSGGTLEFNETDEAEYSTIEDFSSTDSHRDIRTKGIRYTVPTISLIDLLEKHHAPECIDYLSIDTEGSEYEILSAFDFSRYRIAVITVEHNYTPNRERIHELLANHGFRRVHEAWSKFDDWYVQAGRP